MNPVLRLARPVGLGHNELRRPVDRVDGLVVGFAVLLGDRGRECPVRTPIRHLAVVERRQCVGLVGEQELAGATGPDDRVGLLEGDQL